MVEQKKQKINGLATAAIFGVEIIGLGTAGVSGLTFAGVLVLTIIAIDYYNKKN